VLDEVQKIPRLLDIAHHHIETSNLKFALTGSSARKLKRGAANLLAGRAFVNHLFPLTHIEMGDAFDEMTAMKFGTLPKVTQFYNDDERVAFLKAYALTYLKEEVWAEHIVRNLEPFRKFLEIAAQSNGEVINYTNIARDVGADTKTVQSYFQILEDTLIGFLLEPYYKSVRKQQRHNPKFYFFDIGVKRALDRTLTQELVPNTYGFGKLFEHLVIVEAIRLNDYKKKDYKFYYLLTKDRAEIDLIVERPGLPTALVEIKSANRIDERSTNIIERFVNDMPNTEGYCLSRDPIPKRIGSVSVLPWLEGLQAIGL
jgi:predicted AAA+ superfamily ATPase